MESEASEVLDVTDHNHVNTTEPISSASTLLHNSLNLPSCVVNGTAARC